MTTRFGMRVLGISFRTEFINDNQIQTPREVHLELADLGSVKSPPLVISNNRKEDKWDATQIYRLDIKGQVTTANWFWERSVEVNIATEDDAREIIDYF